MKLNKLPKPFLFFVIALIFLAIGVIAGKKDLRISPQKISLPSVSSDVLFLTQPVTSLSGGKIEKIEGNALWFSQQFTYQPQGLAAAPSPGQPQVMPTPVTKKLTFKVTIGPNTQINRPENYIPYLLKTVSPAPSPKLTIKDLKVGQFVNSISTNVDLRTLSQPEFEASSIQLPSIPNSLSGRIAKISQNSLILKAFPPQPPMLSMETTPVPPQEKEYTVTVTSETEISRYAPPKPVSTEGTPPPPQPSTPEELSLSDLAPNTTINVYTNVDVTTTQKFTALRIEPMQIASEITPSPTPFTPPTVPPITQPAATSGAITAP